MDINNKDSIKKIIQNKTNFFFQATKDNGKIYAAVSAVAGFISDVLQPLAPLAEYVFYIFILISLLALLIYFIVGSMKERIASFLVLSLTVLFVSGGIFGIQSITKSEKGILSDTIPAITSLQSSLGIIGKGIADIKQDTAEIKKSTKEISSKLDILGEKVGKQGGIISKPNTPEEYYSNARHYELKGNFVNARKAYLKYFSFKQDYIDPHINYSKLLRVQEGRVGAKEIYEGIASKYPTATAPKLAIALLSSEDRAKKLKKLLTEYPDYSPILYYLSNEFSQSKVGQQTLVEKRLEKEYLEKFLYAVKHGKFLKYYIDKNIAASHAEDARRRLSIINEFIKANSKVWANPVNFILESINEKDNAITFKFNILEPVKKVGYAEKKDGPYKFLSSTTSSIMTPAGTTYYYDGKLKVSKDKITMYIIYFDKKGNENGPFNVLNLDQKDCDSGNRDMCLEIGFYYFNIGIINKAQSNWDKACQAKEIVDGRYAKGCYNLGVMYEKGQGVKQDYLKAKELYSKACDGGISDGCFNLGVMYDNGQGVKQDFFKATELYGKACDGGDAEGCSNLGVMYAKGQGVKQDYFKATELYGKACDGGDAEGCSNLGVMYGKGRGVKQDFFKATELYGKACDGGDAEGCFNLGVMYGKGRGVKQDFFKATELYGKACDGGNTSGCYNLGVMYYKGKGVKKDYSKATELYDKACDGGNTSGCVNLGFMYENGRGVKQDYLKTKKYYKKACDNGYIEGCNALKKLESQDDLSKKYEKKNPKSYLMLASKYMHSKENIKAVEFLEKSCVADSAKGCFKLAKIYFYGEMEIEKDKKKGMQLYEKACKLGNGKGCYVFAHNTFWLGVGQRKEKNNCDKVIKFYQKACNLNSGDGCYELAVMYDKGKYVKKDTKKAKVLYKKACDNGSFFGCTSIE